VVIRRKKHLFRAATYNPVTGAYENNNGKYDSYLDARKEQWKCDKCDKLFQNFRSLRDHKATVHSY
jgi:hypothetical protein